MSMTRRSRRGSRRLRIGGAVLAALALVSWRAPWAAAGSPTLTMAPAPASRAYADGQSISLSVGPNSRFSPYSRIEVLECAAPKGALPVDDSTCDGNTAQYGSVIVAADGSFGLPAYTLYQLPNTVLGEQRNHAPVCNAAQECVLYIGQDQNDFSQPKMFSPVFTVGSTAPIGSAPPPVGGAAPPGGSGPSGGSNPPTGASGSSSASAAVSLSDPSSSASGGTVSAGVSAVPAGSLAFTGIAEVPWLLGTGALLMVLGSAGIHLRRRAEP
jgi:hypothetical protein